MKTIIRKICAFIFFGILIIQGCTKEENNNSFIPEVSNHVDDFLLQATDVQNTTTTVSYIWKNNGVRASIDKSGLISSGSGNLTIYDSKGLKMYFSDLNTTGDDISIAGDSGNWKIQLDLTNCSGFLNFRVENADLHRKSNESLILDQYILANNITVEPTSTGLYYIETLEGTGEKANLNTWVEIMYTCRLVSDNQVVMTNDSSTAAINNLYSPSFFYGASRLVLGNISPAGLNQGIALMKEGGKARLIFPSSLGYGGQSVQNIPSYSSMIFDIELVKVIPDIKTYENDLMMEYLDRYGISKDSVNGIFIKTTKAGTGLFPVSGDQVKLNYKGKFMNGRGFDESAVPITFTIGSGLILPGFEAGVKLVNKGGSATIVIPFYYAYGEFGRFDAYGVTLIPPFTTLIFDISVTDITKK